MNMTTRCGIMAILLICGLATLACAAQSPILLGMEAVTRDKDDVKEDVLLPLYEKTAATAIIVQGKVKQMDAPKEFNNRTMSFTYDFSGFDDQPFMKSKKTKICRIDRSDYVLSQSARSQTTENQWPALESCIAAIVEHAKSKGITVFWVSTNGFQAKGGVYWDNYMAHLTHIYKAIKAASPINIVIAGGVEPTEAAIKKFYDAGGKGLFDMLAVGGWSEKGIDPSDLALTHAILERNADADKKIFITNWSPKTDWSPSGMREFLTADYRTLTTKTATYDPAWVSGLFFYPMNDHYRYVAGAPAGTVPQRYMSGGGLVDVNGKPKEDLLDVIFSGKAAQTMTKDEARIAAMMTDATFTPDEQKEAALIMKTGEFYGTKVKLSNNAGSYPFSRYIYMSPTLSKTLTTRDLRDFYKPKDYKLISARVWLWHEPSPEIKNSAQAMAKGIIQKIYDDIVAIKSKYPELALFDEEHVTLSDNSLYYAPGKPDSSRKIALPSIHITISEPDLARPVSAVVWYRDIYPKQKLDVYHRVAAEDEELSKRAYDIIAHNFEPLIQAEVALDSYPVRIDN